MSNQLQITGGAKVRGLNGVITGTTGVLDSLPINSPNGIPQLDSSGKILVSQLPNSVMEFLGTWNAATNTPTLADGTGNAGDVYLCTVAGTVNFGSGPIVFQDGDYVVYSGSTWERSGGAMGTVTSVAASITGNSVGITGSPITTAGTLAFAFAGTNLQYINGQGNLVTFPALTGYVPYTGATANVNLGAYSITATSLIKAGGVDTQFLKADGSVDNNTYLTADDLPSTLSLYATTAAASVSGYFKLVTTIDDPDFNTTAVDVSTGEITATDQLISSLISPPNLINGNPGVFNVSTYGNIKKVSGSGESEFYFKIYKRSSAGVETLVGTSSNTIPVVNTGYSEFFATAIWNDGIFDVTDTIVLKYYATRISGGSNPTYNFQFGGVAPVRTIVPIPTAVIPNIYLEDLADVEDGTASNNDGIYYDSSVSLWKYKSIAEVLGYTPANDASVVHLAGTETITGAKTFTGLTDFQNSAFFGKGVYLTKNSVPTTFYSGSLTLYSGISANKNIIFSDDSTNTQFVFDNSNRIYTFPAATGTIALTSDLSSYVTLGTTQTISGLKTFTALATNNEAIGIKLTTSVVSTGGYLTLNSKVVGTLHSLILAPDSTTNRAEFSFDNTALRTYTLPNATGTIALTSNLTNMVTGTGTTNYLPKFTGASTIGNSLVFDNGTNVGINTTTIGSRLQVGGNAAIGYTASTVAPTNGLSVLGQTNIGSATAFIKIIPAWLAGGIWLDISTGGPSGIGSGGAGVNPWVAYAAASDQWFTGAVTGDIAYRNTTGRLLFGNTSGNAAMAISGDNIGMGTITIGSKLQVNGNAAIGYSASTAAPALGLVVSGSTLIGTTTDAGYKLDVNGTGRFSGNSLSLQGGTYPSITAKATSTFPIFSLVNDAQAAQWNIELGRTTSGNLEFYNGGTKVYFTPAGAATFSGNIYQSGTSNIIQQSASNSYSGGSVLDIYNVSATGYGVYIQGGASTNYALSVNNYLGSNLFKVLGTGAATFSSSVTAKGTGNYNGFIADNSSSATIGGGYFAAYSFGVQRGIFGIAGAISGATDNNMAIFAEGGLGIKFFVNGSGTASHIMTSSGNVGIGTVGPSVNLDVRSSSTSAPSFISTGNSDISKFISIYGGTSGDAVSAIWWKSGQSLKLGTATSNNGASESIKMTITDGGNVLVGTTTDLGNKLNVGGTISSYAATGNIRAYSTNPANDAIVFAGWTGETGIEMRYNPNTAVSYIQNNYPVTSGQPYGDIHFRRNNAGTYNTIMLLQASTGNLEITSGSIKTGSGPTMKFVNTYAGSVFLAGGYTILEVQVNGTTKFIQLYNSLN